MSLDKHVLSIFPLLFALLCPPSAALAEEERCTQDMEITDIRFSATATVGVPVRFSDIGCAVIWRNLQCVMDQMRFDSSAMVSDFHTEEQVPMEEAFFAANSGVDTPMGYGVVAFKERERAEKFVSEKGGMVLTYAGLLEMQLD